MIRHREEVGILRFKLRIVFRLSLNFVPQIEKQFLDGQHPITQVFPLGLDVRIALQGFEQGLGKGRMGPLSRARPLSHPICSGLLRSSRHQDLPGFFTLIPLKSLPIHGCEEQGFNIPIPLPDIAKPPGKTTIEDQQRMVATQLLNRLEHIAHRNEAFILESGRLGPRIGRQ